MLGLVLALLMGRLAGAESGVASAAMVTAGPATPDATDDSRQAYSALQDLLGLPMSWQKIHAAEVLAFFGKGDLVRKALGPEIATADSSHFRVGIWRVMAETSASAEERAGWLAKIEGVLFDPAAWDHPNAIESLCKLGYRVSGKTLRLVREKAVSVKGAHALLYLWAQQLAGDPGISPRIASFLLSSDPETREYAAYALRWLNLDDAAVRQALAAAADIEPADSIAYSSVLGAALVLNADPARAAVWQQRLDRLLVDNGSADDRLESSQALMRCYRVADLPRLIPLLAPGRETDTRVAAAWTILYVHGKQAETANRR